MVGRSFIALCKRVVRAAHLLVGTKMSARIINSSLRSTESRALTVDLRSSDHAANCLLKVWGQRIG